MYDRRPVVNLPIIVGTTATVSQPIPWGDQISGCIKIPASGITTITWYASTDSTNFYPAYDWTVGTPVAVTQTVTASTIVGIPSALIGAAAIKAVATGQSDTGGTINVSVKN